MKRGGIVWITGIPASGKSTLAGILANKIRMAGGHAEIIDGDEVRQIVSRGLTWSREDRKENVRRMSWIAKKIAKNDVWAIVAAVSPYKEDRDEAKTSAQAEGSYFLEVHTKCALNIARDRDEKKTYSRLAVTGQDAPYEESSEAFAVDMGEDTADEAALRVWDVLLWRPDDNPPVVCIGRGHTGTRLVSMLMQDMGIHIGQHEQINGCEDSLEWVRLIYRMVEESGPVAEMPTGSFYKSEIRNTARGILKNGHVVPGAPWGWKLPETTLLLPMFVDAFPEAKWIHCVRHPVSSTLRNFHQTADPFTKLGSATVGGAYSYSGRRAEDVLSDEEWLRSALTWKHQVTRAMKFGRSLGAKKYIELKYEDVCANPDWALSTLERFTGFGRVRARPSLDINPARMNKWSPNDPLAPVIWQHCEDTAKALGYSYLEGSI